MISINSLEVIAVVITTYVMVDMRGTTPVRRRETALMRAYNEAAVEWVKRCRGGREPARKSRGVDETNG